MRNIYKESSNSNRTGKAVRISAIIVLIMVWILIDKGNVYGQKLSALKLADKNKISTTIESPSFTKSTEEVKTPIVDQSTFNMGPNPVHHELVFDFEFTVRGDTPYDVVDAMGRLMDSGRFVEGISRQSINLSNLKNGMYLVRLKIGNKLDVRRIIKN